MAFVSFNTVAKMEAGKENIIGGNLQLQIIKN